MATPLPPQSFNSPPSAPEGWKAEWSTDYKTWFYENIYTGVSQWEYPTPPLQQPMAPPGEVYAPPYGTAQQPSPAAAGFPPTPEPQPPVSAAQEMQPPTGPDGDRGLGNIGGGLLGLAGGLLAGAVITHEVDEHKEHHSKLDFLTGGHRPGGGGFLSGITGAAGGKLFGGMGGSNTPAGPAPLAAGGLHNAYSPFAGAGGPPLHIHCAVFCDVDVTHQVRRMVTPSQTLSIDLGDNALASAFGNPWENNRKQFSVLYSYGQRPWELLATCQGNGDTLSIIPHQPLDNTRMKFVQDPRSRVIALVWGTGNGMEGGKGPLLKIQQLETEGEFPATDEWMGFDGLCGWSKTAVVYYRTSNGGVAIATARQSGTCRLPWNPLARWT